MNGRFRSSRTRSGGSSVTGLQRGRAGADDFHVAVRCPVSRACFISAAISGSSSTISTAFSRGVRLTQRHYKERCFPAIAGL